MTEKVFVNSRVSMITSKGIKNFPADFISANSCYEIGLPGKTLLIGEEFFGQYEIITPAGESIFHVENYLKAKFILYANRNTPLLILMPDNEAHLQKAVQLYEIYLDSLIKEIEVDYKKSLPGEKNLRQVVNEIFKQLNLIRI